MSKMIIDGGKTPAIITDIANPVSNHIYTQIGYVPVIEVEHYKWM
jgi:predicted GNAT family acetyltransferase